MTNWQKKYIQFPVKYHPKVPQKKNNKKKQHTFAI